jgi:hypothetical protein
VLANALCPTSSAVSILTSPTRTWAIDSRPRQFVMAFVFALPGGNPTTVAVPRFARLSLVTGAVALDPRRMGGEGRRLPSVLPAQMTAKKV